MNLIDELAKLDELYRSGSLTADEFQLAKQRLLQPEELAPPIISSVAADKLDSLVDSYRFDLLSQLDREWELEKEQYMVTGKYGQRYLPERSTAWGGMIFMTLFGVFWTVMASGLIFSSGPSLPTPVAGLFPLFGVLFCGFVIVMSLSAIKKANEYEQAKEKYTARRRAIINSDSRY